MLFPDQIFVVDNIKPNYPYLSIKELLNSNQFKQYEYIIKLDDDLIVLTDNWIDKLCKLYLNKKDLHKDNLAYVTPLINNNPYGFKKIIELSKELNNEYFNKIARKHFIGLQQDFSYGPYRIVDKNTISSGTCGTI